MRGFGEEMARQGRIAKIAKFKDHISLKCNVTSPVGLYIYLIITICICSSIYLFISTLILRSIFICLNLFIFIYFI